MGVTRFAFTPRNDGLVTFDLWAARGVNVFSGGVQTNGVRHVSRGGIAYAVTWDSWHEYDIELRGIKPATRAFMFERLWAWWSHCVGGGTFSLAMDSDQASATTLLSAAAQNATALSVASSTGFGGTDWVFIEDALDPSRFLRAQLRTVASPTSVLLVNPLAVSFGANSVIRHAEYFPKCMATSRDIPFRERDAERGPGVWDLSLSVRTVR